MYRVLSVLSIPLLSSWSQLLAVVLSIVLLFAIWRMRSKLSKLGVILDRMDDITKRMESCAIKSEGVLVEAEKILSIAKGNQTLAEIQRDEALGAVKKVREVAEVVKEAVSRDPNKRTRASDSAGDGVIPKPDLPNVS